MTTETKTIESQDFLRFNEELFDLVTDGEIDDAGLHRMAEERVDGLLAKFDRAVATDLARGVALSDAAKGFRPHLPGVYMALLRAGESCGSFDGILGCVVSESRRFKRERRGTWMPFAYPVIVVALACLAIAVVFLKLAPKVIEIYQQLGAALPTPTLVLFNLAYALRNNWLIVAAVVGFVGFLFFILVTGRVATATEDTARMNMPIVGPTLHNGMMASFCRSLRAFLNSGVAEADGLTLTLLSIRSEAGQRFIDGVRSRVQDGETLADVLASHPYSMKPIQRMDRSLGDKGDVKEMLLAVGDFFDKKRRRTRHILGLTTAVLAVAAMVATGVVIILLYLPLFKIPTIIG